MRFERSLVVLKNYLGDTVMASSLVREVARHSGAIDLLGAPLVEQILRFEDFRARAHDPGNLNRPAQLWKMARQVRQGQYDVAFIVNRSFRSALLVRMAGIPIRVGHATEGRGRLLTHKVPYDQDRNEAECYLDLLRPLNLWSPDLAVQPRLWLSEAELAQGRQMVNGSAAGLQAGARHPYKQIPVPILREIASQLSKDKGLVYFGGKEEEPLLNQVGAPGVDLVGKTTVRETMAALANLKTMVGGDTGVMHLAAAVGCPTVTVFGPTPVKKWGWFESPHQVVQAPDGDISKVSAQAILDAVGRVDCG